MLFSKWSKDWSHFMEQHNVLSLLFIAETWKIDKLVHGCETRNSTVPDCSFEDYLQGKKPLTEVCFWFQRLVISFIYCNFDATKILAKKYIGCQFDSCVVLNYKASETFILGLVSYWFYHQMNRVQWLKSGICLKHMM